MFSFLSSFTRSVRSLTLSAFFPSLPLAHSHSPNLYYTTHTADLPLTCRARLAVVSSAKEHKTSLASVFTALLALLYGRMKLQQRSVEEKNVRELVVTVLSELRKQVSLESLAPRQRKKLTSEESRNTNITSTQHSHLSPILPNRTSATSFCSTSTPPLVVSVSGPKSRRSWRAMPTFAPSRWSIRARS